MKHIFKYCILVFICQINIINTCYSFNFTYSDNAVVKTDNRYYYFLNKNWSISFLYGISNFDVSKINEKLISIPLSKYSNYFNNYGIQIVHYLEDFSFSLNIYYLNNYINGNIFANDSIKGNPDWTTNVPLYFINKSKGIDINFNGHYIFHLFNKLDTDLKLGVGYYGFNFEAQKNVKEFVEKDNITYTINPIGIADFQINNWVMNVGIDFNYNFYSRFVLGFSFEYILPFYSNDDIFKFSGYRLSLSLGMIFGYK